MKPIHLNIRLKIVLGYIIILLCLGVSILIVVERLSALQDEINFIANHDIEVHEELNQLEINLLEMQSGQRGYVITGDESYLNPYNSARIDWVERYNRLSTLITDNPVQLKNLETIKAAIEQWISTAGDKVINLRRDNNTIEISKYYQDDSGQVRISQIREQFSSFRATEMQLTAARVSKLDTNNNNLRIVLFLVLGLVTIFSILIALYISSSIVKTIKNVIDTLHRIVSSEGEVQTRIKVNTNDEIKELADETNNLLDSFNKQNWIQTRVADVSLTYQGFNHINELSEAFVHQITPIIDAAYGAVYVRHTQNSGVVQYVRTASFAGSGEEAAASSSFKPGEGLAGQCVVDKRMYHMEDLPVDYVKISSALGSTMPRSLLVIPVFYEGKVLAVVEFASLHSFDDRHMKLLESVQQTFGTAINSVMGRMEVERLLNESQMLTEELQAQSEELQAQSEELQMQQEQLRLTNEFLEDQKGLVEQRAEELEKAKDELEDYSKKLEASSQYKTDFLANMSHELRTPLNSILILSQMLYENDNHTLTEEEQHYSHVIHSAGTDLLSLIDDILDLSKIEAGKLDVMVDEVNMTELPGVMQQLFTPVADSKQITFNAYIEESAPKLISTDGHRLQHIVKNLLSNAFKFTEKGSVTLRISQADSAVISQLYDGEMPFESMVAISVTDTGIGIAPDKQEIIFEAFQQADGTTNRQYGGTGLGLSICREFTRLLGGKLVLESKVDEGSTFTLYLPSISEEFAHSRTVIHSSHRQTAVGDDATIVVQEASFKDIQLAEDLKTGASKEEKQLFGGKKILLVDDDERNLFALKTSLGNKGIIVKSASNGKQCLEILNEEPDFDVVLMDIMMPIMDGYEAMRNIRLNPDWSNLPIIALTAKAMRQDREKCLEAGASDYITKPLQMEQLFSLLRVWLTKQEG